MKAHQLILDGQSLLVEHLAPLFRGEEVRLSIDPAVAPRVQAARALVEAHVQRGDAVYGLTTGFGKLKNVAIDEADLTKLQENLVVSHCCGVGDPLSDAEVRAVQILRLNGLLRGHSGVRMELLESLVRLFEKGFVPIVPERGSVGASGDLAPLAHMTAAYMGFGSARVLGRTLPAKEALAAIAEEPIRLTAKEGLALLNGTEVMAGVGSGVWLRAANLSRAADVVAALSLEALSGSQRPFDARFAELKGQAGHERTSSNVRRLLEDSEVLKSHEGCGRVQDPYSLRCVPQIHGAAKTAIAHVGSILAAEMNSVTDNPVLFPETGEIISAGQFHGQEISMALDYLVLGLATLANVSERRVEQLVNPDLSHLPSFLTEQPGLNSGLMIAQVAAAALASENKVLAHPASVDTVPTSANQEDHVSMGMTAALKARQVVENAERVVGIELLCAGQAREFNRDLRAGRGAQAAYDCLRERVEPLHADRFLHDDIVAAVDLVASGELVTRVEAVVGALAS